MTLPTSPPVVGSQHSVASISVNGELREMPVGSTVLELIEKMGLRPELVAVEINRDLIRRASFADRQIRDADRVEIVEFVGGG